MIENANPYPQFLFHSFNPRRASRGVGAAWMRVKFLPKDEFVFFWMTERDIETNIKIHGMHRELVKAQLAYRRPRHNPFNDSPNLPTQTK